MMAMDVIRVRKAVLTNAIPPLKWHFYIGVDKKNQLCASQPYILINRMIFEMSMEDKS